MKYIALLLALSVTGLTSLSAAPKGQNIDQFLEKQEQKAAEKGWKYKESKSREIFAIIDTNGDGIITSPEKKAYYASKKKK